MPLLLLTCEHGGNAIPERYAALFRGQKRRLSTHEGYDLGAAAVAERLARALDAPLLLATTSRLVVDLNRSIGHPSLFSDVTRALPAEDRRVLLEEHYLPHRAAVERAVAMSVSRRVSVVHVAVHSFTPVLRGKTREADVGLLFDPARPGEAALVARLRRALQSRDDALRVRRNYPYRGTSDGLTTTLRGRHPAAAYVGLELEMNQALLRTPAGITRLSKILAAALGAGLGAGHPR